MPTLIDATQIPGGDLHPDRVEAAARSLRGIGSATERQGRALVATWKRLTHHYTAPEDEDLLAVLGPVTGQTDTMASQLATTARALERFADDIRPIATALARLRSEAETFVADVSGGVVETTPKARGMMSTETVAWNQHIPTVDANNRLIARVNDQVELLWAAERRCANAIRRLTGDRPLVAGDSAGATTATAYGVSTIRAGTATDWGAAGEPDFSIPDRMLTTALEVAAETIQGLAPAVGLDLHGNPPDWNWSPSNLVDYHHSNVRFTVNVAASVVAFSDVGRHLARTDGRLGTATRRQQARTVLTIHSLAHDAVTGAKADPVDFGTRVGLTVAGTVLGGGSGAGVKAAELGAKGARVAERLAVASRVADTVARHAAHRALDALDSSPRLATSAGRFSGRDLAVVPGTPKDLSLTMAGDPPRHGHAGGGGDGPEPDHPTPHHVESHHATTHPDGAKKIGKDVDNRGPDGDAGYPELRGGPGEPELIHARRDRYESAPAREGLEIQPIRGSLIRERNVALSHSEWAAADFFRDRGYHLLAMDRKIPRPNGRTADFMIMGVGDMDVYTPTGPLTRHRLERGVVAKDGQTSFVFINVDAFDVDLVQVTEGLRAVWSNPEGQSIDRVMIVKDHRLIIDARRPE